MMPGNRQQGNAAAVLIPAEHIVLTDERNLV